MLNITETGRNHLVAIGGPPAPVANEVQAATAGDWHEGVAVEPLQGERTPLVQADPDLRAAANPFCRGGADQDIEAGSSDSQDQDPAPCLFDKICSSAVIVTGGAAIMTVSGMLMKDLGLTNLWSRLALGAIGLSIAGAGTAFGIIQVRSHCDSPAPAQ